MAAASAQRALAAAPQNTTNPHSETLCIELVLFPSLGYRLPASFPCQGIMKGWEVGECRWFFVPTSMGFYAGFLGEEGR
jgi:hypothetical protein